MLPVKYISFCLLATISTCQPPPGSPPDNRWEHFDHDLTNHEPLDEDNVEHPVFRQTSPEDHELADNELPSDVDNGPVVGFGLPVLPVLGASLDAFAVGAKMKGAAALAIADAKVLALKHKAAFDKALIDAKLEHDLMASKARLAGHKMLFHSAILGTDRTAGPEDTPEAIKHDVDRDMEGVSSGDNHPFPQMLNHFSEFFAKAPAKREAPQEMSFRGPHMKRDEEMFLWSLNNFGREGEQLRQQPEQQNHPELQNILEDPLEDDEALRPVEEVHTNIVPAGAEFPARMADNPLLGRMNPRHFGHFHHKAFGYHSGHDGFSSGMHGAHAPGLAGHGIGGLGHFGRPTEVTINNQQNTFTNAVPTSAGNANFQISQSTGHAGSSQSHSATNQDHHGHGHGHGFRAAEDKQRNPKLTSSRTPSTQMQMLRGNLKMTSNSGVPAEPKLGQAQDMHLADHFLGMRGLMPAESGSMIGMTHNHNQQNQ